MIKNKELRKYAEGLNLNPVIPAVIFVVMGIAFIALPQISAASLHITHEISAPADKVWRIIANVDNEPYYWSTFKEINNIKKTDNITEREVTISAGPQNNTSHQIVTVYPDEMKIQTNLTQGLVTGSRILELESLSANKSRLDVIWDIDLSGIPIIGRGFAENGIKQTTEEALNRIAQAAE
jgi:Polyketide cyclase / dehydrase and lipid transport